MKNYRVVVEEVCRGWEWVEASSEEEAEQIVQNMFYKGEIDLSAYNSEMFIDVVDEEEIEQ